MWAFLAVQALFIIWLVAGLASVYAAPTSAQLAHGCYNHNWYPVVVENDANAYAAYELWFGTGRELPRFAIVLIREGVGGSLVIGHQLFDGPMELGNLSVLPEKGRACDCGSIGCLETTGGIHGILESVAMNLQAKYLEIPSADSVESAAELTESPDSDIVEAAEKAFKGSYSRGADGLMSCAS